MFLGAVNDLNWFLRKFPGSSKQPLSEMCPVLVLLVFNDLTSALNLPVSCYFLFA